MQKRTYSAPKIEVLEIQIEQGFAGSNDGNTMPTNDLPSFGNGGW